MANWTDADIINGIQGTTAQRDAALKQVFLDAKLRGTIRSLVRDEQRAKDVFQETTIKFDRALRSGTFEGRSGWRTYFVGIAKWHLVDERRKKANQGQELKPEVLDGATEHPEMVLIEGERRHLLKAAIAQLTEPCPQVLELYMLSYSMKEIADQMDKKEDAAKKEAERCRKRLRDLIANSPELLHVLNLKTAQS